MTGNKGDRKLFFFFCLVLIIHLALSYIYFSTSRVVFYTLMAIKLLQKCYCKQIRTSFRIRVMTYFVLSSIKNPLKTLKKVTIFAPKNFRVKL